MASSGQAFSYLSLDKRKPIQSLSIDDKKAIKILFRETLGKVIKSLNKEKEATLEMFELFVQDGDLPNLDEEQEEDLCALLHFFDDSEALLKEELAEEVVSVYPAVLRLRGKGKSLSESKQKTADTDPETQYHQFLRFADHFDLLATRLSRADSVLSDQWFPEDTYESHLSNLSLLLDRPSVVLNLFKEPTPEPKEMKKGPSIAGPIDIKKVREIVNTYQSKSCLSGAVFGLFDRVRSSRIKELQRLVDCPVLLSSFTLNAATLEDEQQKLGLKLEAKLRADPTVPLIVEEITKREQKALGFNYYTTNYYFCTLKNGILEKNYLDGALIKGLAFSERPFVSDGRWRRKNRSKLPEKLQNYLDINHKIGTTSQAIENVLAGKDILAKKNESDYSDTTKRRISLFRGVARLGPRSSGTDEVIAKLGALFHQGKNQAYS